MVKDLIAKNVFESIDRLIDGTQEFEIPFCSIGLLEEILLSEGVNVDKYDLSTNGWCVDFWKTYEIKGKKIRAGGSMYYGTLYLSLEP